MQVVRVLVCVSARVLALVQWMNGQTPNPKTLNGKNPCDIMKEIWFMEQNTSVDWVKVKF